MREKDSKLRTKAYYFYNLVKEKLSNSDIAQRIASGTFWSLTGSIFGKAIMLLSGIICARILEKEQYGEFGMLRSTILMFMVFGLAGLGITATKFISEYRTKKDSKRIASIYQISVILIFILASISSTVYYFLSDYIAEVRLSSPHLILAIKYGVILLFFSILDGLQNGILSGFESFKSLAQINLYSSICKGGTSVLGAYFYGVDGAILGLGLGFSLQCFMNHFFIRKELQKEQIHLSIKYLKLEDFQIFYKFGVPLALASILYGPIFWYIKEMLVKTNGYETLAIYEVADQWRLIILFVPLTISQIVLPILSSVLNQGEKTYWKVLKLNLGINMLVSFLISLVVCLFSGLIMSFYGKEFNDHWTISLLALSTIFGSASHILGLAIAARDKAWTHFFFSLLFASLLLGLSRLFIVELLWSSVGLASACLLAYIIYSIIQYIYLYFSVQTSNKRTK